MELDTVIHQPIRTKIISILLRDGVSDYTTIKKEADLTDGHMSTHIRALTKAKYIDIRKEFVDNKPRTSYQLSTLGKKKFKEYVKDLKKLIEL